MCELTIVFLVLIVVSGALLSHSRLNQVRSLSDRIIGGEEPANDEQINKIITKLLAAKNWIDDIKEQDRRRVELLRDIRNKMDVSHS
ncbi:MAG: hypothetical protein FVQ85_02925 [Planctomycetes bacterium]|nr:hypothetical protein [Planctomycetota bacterium]